jgi:DNA replication ATP-dependent helicase Dna2
LNQKTILDELRFFVANEQEANFAKLYEVWDKPLSAKLESGESQVLASLTIEGNKQLIVSLVGNDSRFREGDMICLHRGDARNESFVRQATIEAENDGEWLLRADFEKSAVVELSGQFYADLDAMNLKPFFDTALDDIASSSAGRKVLIPLLSEALDTTAIHNDNYDDAADIAEIAGLNEQQVHAVGLGVAAQYLACIQGPPGTGKTKVIGLIARLLAAEGQRILITSHTHMAINNALNKVAKEKVPVAKIGSCSNFKGLDKCVPRFENGSDWEARPDAGYVIGSTPFATCSSRLENFCFDTIIFDEASQITVPLAIMAMRKGKRFVFVGDHKQLPPVVLSKSVLDIESYSIFSKLVVGNPSVSVLLEQTYRMNRWLSEWPSKQYYNGSLSSVGDNKQRKLALQKKPKKYCHILANDHSFVFVPSPGINSRTHSIEEAELVVDLVQSAVDAGIESNEIGIVTPYRNHGKIIRNKLTNRLGTYTAKAIVTDTVERMQGQEREVIIISLCSTDSQFIQSVASFLFQPERLNVAITRPMVKLILIGPQLTENFQVDERLKKINLNIEAYKSLVQSAKHCMLDGEKCGTNTRLA